MEWLNYHHLYYFSVIAQEMSVTRAAKRLRLSQSNLSAQLKQLEDSLGQSLFERSRKRLRLTESGKLALDYAQPIFSSGQELLDVFKNRPLEKRRQVIRVGAMSPLSKNLQFEFVKPLVGDTEIKLVMVEGALSQLVRDLKNHSLDMVLSNMSIRTDEERDVFHHELGEMDVFLVGLGKQRGKYSKLPKDLSQVPVFLPTRESRVRADFDHWIEQTGAKPNVLAEVEDMALLRLFALSGQGLALVPEIVVRNELKDGSLIKIRKIPGLKERFYAITATKKFPHPKVEFLVKKFASRLRLGI